MPKSHDRPRSVPSVMPSLIFNLIQVLVVCYMCVQNNIDYFIAKVSSLRDFFLSFFLSLFLSFSLYFFPKDTRFASTTCI